MKYIIKIGVLLLFVTSTLDIHAQKIRRMEFKNDFLSPLEDSYYKLPNIIHYQLSSKNTGSDTLFPGDSIIYAVRISGKSSPEKAYPIGKIWVNGDSIVISDSLLWEDPSPANPTGRSPLVISRFLAVPEKNSVHGTMNAASNPDSARAMVWLYWNASYNSVQNLELSKQIMVYPNPAINAVSITAKKEEYITLMDIHGKRYDIGIQEKGLGLVLDLKSLSNGVYFIQTSLGVFRFVKNR